HYNITFFLTPRSTFDNFVFENWFIAAPPNNNIIKDWANETVLALSNQKYYIESSPEYNKSIIHDNNYLICHLVLKNIYERNKQRFSNVRIYESNKTAFYYHEKYQWKNLNTNLLKESFDPKKLLVKLTS